MMNAQICHSHTGADSRRPMASAMRMRRSNPDETAEKTSCANGVSVPRCSSRMRIGAVMYQMIASVTKNAITMPTARPITAMMSRLRNSTRCAASVIRLSRGGATSGAVEPLATLRRARRSVGARRLGRRCRAGGRVGGRCALGLVGGVFSLHRLHLAAEDACGLSHALGQRRQLRGSEQQEDDDEDDPQVRTRE